MDLRNQERDGVAFQVHPDSTPTFLAVKRARERRYSTLLGRRDRVLHNGTMRGFALGQGKVPLFGSARASQEEKRRERRAREGKREEKRGERRAAQLSCTLYCSQREAKRAKEGGGRKGRVTLRE